MADDDILVIVFCKIRATRGSRSEVMASFREEVDAFGRPWTHNGKHTEWSLTAERIEQVPYFHSHPDGEGPQ